MRLSLRSAGRARRRQRRRRGLLGCCASAKAGASGRTLAEYRTTPGANARGRRYVTPLPEETGSITVDQDSRSESSRAIPDAWVPGLVKAEGKVARGWQRISSRLYERAASGTFDATAHRLQIEHHLA